MSDKELSVALIDKMKENEKAEAAEFIDGVFKMIGADETVKVPEPVFREIFLPAFIDNDSEAAQAARENWMGIVGSHTSGADVVNLKGEVIFHVPPLVNTSRLNINPTKNTLRSAFAEYGEEVVIHQPSAVGRLMVSMDQSLTGLYSGEQFEKLREQDINDWERIFAYYGVIKSDGSMNSPMMNQKRGNVEDDFE